MRDRVVLYNPVGDTYTMPLGLLAVGSFLAAQGYRVELYDGRLDRGALFDALAGDDLLAVGLSVMTGRPIADALAVSRRIKEMRPETPVVWGGWHPSILPEQCARTPWVDHVVVGQGEESFAELVGRLRDGGDPAGIAGVVSKAGAGLVTGPPRPMADPNRFPPLRYELLDVPAYFALKGKRQLDYYSSQGCPYECTFCADPFVYHRRWKALAADRVVRELVGLARRYDVDDVFFNDDLFFVDAARLERTCDGLVAAGAPFRWVAAGRADLLKRYPDALMEKIRASGCRRISIGAESGSQAMLDEVKKKLTVEDIYRAAVRCNEYGIELAFSFMTGFPDEDPEVLGETVALAKRIKKVNGRFETPIFFYYAYPGTELTAKLARMGVALPESIEGWIDFDLYRGATPWLGRSYEARVERINFYLERAFRRPARWWSPLDWLVFGAARLRAELDFYGLAVEARAVAALRRRRDARRSRVAEQVDWKLEKVCG